jgi:hypothetical protein
MEAKPQNMLFAINILPALEERMIDWLLERDAGSGFTGYAAFGHGAHQDHLTLTEQVRGRQDRIEFRIELPETEIESFIASLQESFSGADIYFYVLPILHSGHL